MESTVETIRTFFKFWRRIDNIACVILLVLIGCLIISFIGFPKDVDEIVDACVYTENGETLSCQIRITGEVTNYPFRSYAQYTICAYRENILVSEMEYNTRTQKYGYCKQHRFTGIKDIENDILVVEMDLHTLFPDLESQRCMVVAPALERNAAMEIVNNSGDNEEFQKHFAWVDN